MGQYLARLITQPTTDQERERCKNIGNTIEKAALLLTLITSVCISWRYRNKIARLWVDHEETLQNIQGAVPKPLEELKIDVDYAVYGGNGVFSKGVKDVTDHVKLKCNGKTSCTVQVNNTFFKGDPCKYHDKIAKVTYACKADQETTGLLTAFAPEREVLHLICPQRNR